MAEYTETEQLLRWALAPVDPPGALTDRLERRLAEMTGAAASELADWELRAMRDPRNWARPAGAAVVVGVAGGALVLVRARQRSRSRAAGTLRLLERGVRSGASGLRARARR